MKISFHADVDFVSSFLFPHWTRLITENEVAFSFSVREVADVLVSYHWLELTQSILKSASILFKWLILSSNFLFFL